MASFLSGLLGMSEQDLRFHVQRANRWTVAPLLSIFPALSFSQTVSSQPPSASPVCEFPVLPLPSQSPHEIFEGQSGEQTRSQSDALAFLPPCALSTADLEVPAEGKLQWLYAEVDVEQGPSQGEREEGLLVSRSEEHLPSWMGGLSQEREEAQRCFSEEGSFDEGAALSSDEEEADDFLLGGLSIAARSQGKEAAHITQLDEGCLVKIMSHLNPCSLGACSLVCHDWLEASSFACSSMILQSAEALPVLLPRFSRIQSLTLKCPPKPNQEELLPSDFALPENLPMLVLGDTSMQLIARTCCNLQKLRLEDCSLSDPGLASILMGCPDLSELSIAYSKGFSGEAFSGLTCKLIKLELEVCEGLTNEGLLAAAAACASLMDLGVMTEQPRAALAKGVESFAAVCTNLKALTIHSCGINDWTLKSFATNCPLLQNLNICCEHSITDAGLAAFFAGLPHMHTVTLQTNHSIFQVPRFGSSLCLSRLRLGFLWQMSDQALQAIANDVNLQELTFITCPTLSNNTLEMIVKGCKKLEKLVLFNEELITTDFVRAYARTGSKARLEFIACAGVTNDIIQKEELQLDTLHVVD